MPRSKVTRSHTTMIDPVRKVLPLLEKTPEVSKIVLGIIVPGLSVAQHRVKIIQINGGIRAEFRGTTSKQQIFIYGSNLEKVEKTISNTHS